MREYCCIGLKSRLEALCFVRSPRATRASRATSPRPSGSVALDFTQSRHIYVVRGVALSRESRQLQQKCRCLVGKMSSIPRTAVVCHRMINALRAGLLLGMCHADLRREAAVIAAKPASALFLDTTVWYLVWVCVGVRVFLWWDERCNGFINVFD